MRQTSNSYCSELLLSAEANVVTYLDRQGTRSHHILREIMESSKFLNEPKIHFLIDCKLDRADIVKRLKYTKDIMYRLINLQN
jgi:hypothetical protein